MRNSEVPAGGGWLNISADGSTSFCGMNHWAALATAEKAIKGLREHATLVDPGGKALWLTDE